MDIFLQSEDDSDNLESLASVDSSTKSDDSSDDLESLASVDSSTKSLLSGEESLFSDCVSTDADSSLSSAEFFDSSSSEGASDDESNDYAFEGVRRHKLPTKASVNNHFRVYGLDVSGCRFNYPKLLIFLKEGIVETFKDIDLYSFKFSLAASCVFKREVDDCIECSQENWFRSPCALKINDNDSEILIDAAISDIERQIENLVKQGSGKHSACN